MIGLARHILQSMGIKASPEDPAVPLPLLPPQSPLYSAVKRACQTLKALAEAGVGVHAERITKIQQRFNACFAPVAEPPKHAEGDASAAAKLRSTSTGSNR